MMDPIQLCTFYINDHLFGIEVDRIQEVIKNHQMTPVPLAPSFVGGLINLRGQIVMAIDLKDKMNLAKTLGYTSQMNIVLRHGDSLISLLVDSVGDVISVSPEQIESEQHHLPQEISKLITGICKTENALLMVLDPEQLI
jgi:purine-binding chemotaxis protein CheW